MSLGKKIAIGVGGVVLAIGLLVFFIFRATSPLVEIAEGFLDELAAGQVAAAHERTSPQFRNGTSLEQLTAFSEGLALDRLKETSWGNRSVETSIGGGPAGHLTGNLRYDDETTRGVEIDFVKQGDHWRIHRLRVDSADLELANAPGRMPPEAELVALVHETMGVFATSVAARSMQGLHDQASIAFKSQFSVARFDEIYGAFFALGDALKVTAGMSPVFSQPPGFDDEGSLVVEGFYPTTPDRTDFKMTYTLEGMSWKLVGLSVNIGGG